MPIALTVRACCGRLWGALPRTVGRSRTGHFAVWAYCVWSHALGAVCPLPFQIGSIAE
jgi:hypothetical protein